MSILLDKYKTLPKNPSTEFCQALSRDELISKSKTSLKRTQFFSTSAIPTVRTELKEEKYDMRLKMDSASYKIESVA